MLTFIKRLIPRWAINHFWHLPKAILANIYYRFPSQQLTVIGITGTSGKTTTSQLLYHILKTAGFKVAVISTISAKIGDQQLDTGLHVTNPDSFSLQKLIRQIIDKDIDYLILETTSHGLSQYRCFGINFTYGVLLNVRHEHLDYHKTWHNYLNAKLKLIDHSQIAVLNSQDKSFSSAKKHASGQILPFSSDQVNQMANNLPGQFNQENIAAAQTVAQHLSIKPIVFSQALNSFPGVDGRMEIIQKKPFYIIIDFAHKPDALERVLTTANQLKKDSNNKSITVFGCAGLRDQQKRPLMGKIASQLADITILTAEDPRTEDTTDINQQIKSGFNKTDDNQFYQQPDRQQAINQAISLAQPGDVVMILGKGHEKSLCFGTIEHPWSEHQAVKQALANQT